MKKRKTTRRRRQKNRFFKRLCLIIILIFGGTYLTQKLNEEDSGKLMAMINIAGPSTKVESQANEELVEEPLKDESSLINLSKAHSTNILLTNLDTGEALAEKNSKLKLYPASLTKIMTVLVAIEMVDDLDQKVVMESLYFDGLFEQEAAVAGFQIDEVVAFRDLLYGAVLPSGADACIALAYLLAGSEENYVALMNEKAIELGLTDTHFSNVTGLHDSRNYSSAEDITYLLKRALENPDFYQVFTTREYSTKPTNLSLDGVSMVNSIFRHATEYPETMTYIQGAKTGFTEEAGLCLASLAVINGENYLLVTAGAGAQAAGPDYVFIEKPLHVIDADLIYSQVATIYE